MLELSGREFALLEEAAIAQVVHCRPSEGRVALDRTAHAVGAAAAPAQLGSGDRDHLYARLAQAGVGGDVAVVADHHPGLEAQQVVAVVPLLALTLERVTAGGHYAHLGNVE